MLKHKQLIIILFLIISFNSYSQNYFNDSSMIYIDKGYFYNNKNKHKIDEFLISKYEVTNLQYCKYLNSVKLNKDTLRKYINLKKEDCQIFIENSNFKVKKGFENYPVVFVSWFGANEFCKFYNLRLPTKNEWEYAALKSKYSSLRNILKKYYIYSGSNNADKVAWYKNNSTNKIHEVGTKKTTSIGIYDMSGNVDEWCKDWYLNGSKKGVYKVIKGGSWYNSEKMLQIFNTRATNPRSTKATIGFRVAKDVATFCNIK